MQVEHKENVLTLSAYFSINRGDLINEKSLFQTQIGINLVLRKKNIWREKKYDENSLLLNLCPKKNLKTQKIDVNL